ncbi:MAG: Asp23/Gls24 family envelope stress response protein [Acidimicrobiales bacterium]
MAITETNQNRVEGNRAEAGAPAPTSAPPTGPNLRQGEMSRGRPGGQRASQLVTDHGRTTIADSVVAKIAGVAAREVPGVHKMGSGAGRALGSIRDVFSSSSQSNVSQGVSVEVGERQAALDIDVVTEYGMSIIDVADGIRRNVTQAVEAMTGLEVTEININVDDVHIPGESEEDNQPKRVS